MPVYKSITREVDEGPPGRRIGAFFDLDRTIEVPFARVLGIDYVATVLAAVRYARTRKGLAP